MALNSTTWGSPSTTSTRRCSSTPTSSARRSSTASGVEDQGVEAASLRVGESRIELLEPLGPDTPVGRFLAKRGPGMHHVAFEVDDVGAELERLKAHDVVLVDETPRRGLFGLQVAFVHPEATGGVLAEFVADGSNDRVRIEIAFEGSQVLTVYVAASTADDLDRALAGAQDSISFEAEDGRYTVSRSARSST